MREAMAAGELRGGVDPDVLLDVIAARRSSRSRVRDVEDQQRLASSLVDILLNGVLPR